MCEAQFVNCGDKKLKRSKSFLTASSFSRSSMFLCFWTTNNTRGPVNMKVGNLGPPVDTFLNCFFRDQEKTFPGH